MAEESGRIVGVATLSLRYQLGLGGLVGSLDELAIEPGAPKSALRRLLKATVGRARALGAVQVIKKANQNTPPPRAALLRARAAAEEALPQGA